jgi:membrane protein DedA with SNARE-associated domain
MLTWAKRNKESIKFFLCSIPIGIFIVLGYSLFRQWVETFQLIDFIGGCVYISVIGMLIQYMYTIYMSQKKK